MKNKYTQKQKDKVIERYHCGDKGSDISKSTGIPKTTIYGWIRAYENNKPKHNKKVDFKMYHELENLVKQQFKVDAPNQVWVSDVTEVKYKEKRIFLCVIIDLYARKVIAYKYSNKNNTYLTKGTFERAYFSRNPGKELIFHSDQGSNYVSRTFRMCLTEKGVKQSFSAKGVPYDNSVCESFFSIYKQEEFYRKEYHSEMEVKRCINDFMLFYNTKRPHSMIRYRNPNAYEEAYYSRLADNN